MTSDTPDEAGCNAAERKRGSGARIVYNRLREEILDLTLPPGTPIDEITLADRLSMSRTPVREALARLAGEGLVTALTNRSTVVAPIDFANLNAFFDALTLMYRVTTRLAAEYRDDDDMAEICAAQASYAKAVEAGDDALMIARNRDFHMAIAGAARNPYYGQLFARLLDEGRRILRLYYYPDFIPRTPHPYVLEHEAMIAAIAARDVALCDTLAKAHADQIVRQIQDRVSRDGRQHPAL